MIKTNRNTALASRIRELFLDGKWIANTNYKVQVQSVTFNQAIIRIYGLNSMAALTFHINYYLEGMIKVLDTGELEMSDKYSYALPEMKNENDWSNLVNRFISNAEIFARKIECLNDEVLDEPFVDAQYGTWQRNIDGVIEHSYYHLGQIVLIRKLIENL